MAISVRLGSVALFALVAVACKQQPRAAGDAPVTAEGKAYVQNLKFANVAMKATESYTGQVVTEIEGMITNAGDRTVESAEVACLFYDNLPQLILRERVPIVKRPLKPGETRAFRLAFDDIPSTWNNRMPNLVIAQIRLS